PSERSSEEEDIPITRIQLHLAFGCYFSHLDASLEGRILDHFLWLRDYTRHSPFPKNIWKIQSMINLSRNMLLWPYPPVIHGVAIRAETTYQGSIREPVTSEQAERAVLCTRT
ncbi:hypothetical protein TNCV_713151, partial [Trichonephila clavipes]